MEYRNAKRLASGDIDCEINHPEFGWIPFTASPNDTEALGRAVYAAADAPSLPAKTGPTQAEILTAWRARVRVSPFQAKEQLRRDGLLTAAEAIVAAASPTAQMAWKEAGEFRRNSPTILALAGALGLSDTQLDTMFTAAALIEA